MNPQNFWAVVNKTAAGGHWLWQGEITECGFGKLNYDGWVHLAHDIAWLITRGVVPDGFQVFHSCAIARCVNPEHLWIGTSEEAENDGVRKARVKRKTGRPRIWANDAEKSRAYRLRKKCESQQIGPKRP